VAAVSILRRFLTEDLKSLVRTSPGEEAPHSAVRASVPTASDGQVRAPAPARRPGMKTVILNWRSGENDPFTVVNETVRQHFHACGKNVETIEISTVDWPDRLVELIPGGIDFVFTWQGLGSRVVVADGGRSLWEHLKIPLICVHGDHPSHMPPNHELESRYCFHLYNNAEFARYSNRHFRRERSATVIDIPQLHREPRLAQRVGDWFVIAKNIDDPAVTERAWRERYDKQLFDAYMTAVETLKSRFAREPYVEIHDALDDVITHNGLAPLSAAVNAELHHQYHRDVDLYLRSYRSVIAVESVREFPLLIYGRGWDRIARTAPAHHRFEAGRDMADSQAMYYTRFGLVDVSPSKGLHDRTRRAMVNGTGFLSSANLEESFSNIRRFDGLFWSFGRRDLAQKCAAVMSDPDTHHALAEEFAHSYHDRFHFKNFVSRLDELARLASIGAA